MAEIALVGCGDVGLALAACLAEVGHSVLASDGDRVRAERLSRGRFDGVDAQLARTLAKLAKRGRVRFVDDMRFAIGHAEFVFIVDPPDDGRTQGRAPGIADVVTAIASNATPGSILVLASPSQPGTAATFRAALELHGVEPESVGVVSCPISLTRDGLGGSSFEPERIVIGADEPELARRVAALFCPIPVALLFMTSRSAELISVADRVGIADASDQELVSLCTSFGADVTDVRRTIRFDREADAESEIKR